MSSDEEDEKMRFAALRNAQAILAVRVEAERQMRETRQALEEQTRVLEILNRMGGALAAQHEPNEIVQAVTDAAREVTGATACVFGAALAGEGLLHSDDLLADPRAVAFEVRAEQTSDPPFRSYLAVPVVSRTGAAIGSLFCGHPEPGVFTDRAVQLVNGIAAQASLALQNANAFADAKRLAEAERTARSEMERVSLMKDEFLATLSHELRTPLNAMLGWSELLLHKARDPDTVRGLDAIVRNAKAQAQLIEDLLDMNRIVSGKLRLDVQPVDLASIIESALDSVRPSIESRSMRVRKTLDPLGGTVFGDPHRLQQVVWNLLSNAVKFTPKGGKIDLLLRCVNSHVEITVTDTGIGIESEFLPHLFERFRQADASSTRKHGGLGLGLAIVKQLVEMHGGSVHAESPGSGQGTTLVVSLPVRAVRDEVHAKHPRTGPHVALTSPFEVELTGITALVVDDEPDACELLARILREANAQVITATSADQAFDLIQSMRPTVLVSDIGMPDRDGYELLRKLRALPDDQGGATPAIAVTAFARSEDRTRALLAGYQVHIAKPIDARELVVTLASLTGRARPRSG